MNKYFKEQNEKLSREIEQIPLEAALKDEVLADRKIKLIDLQAQINRTISMTEENTNLDNDKCKEWMKVADKKFAKFAKTIEKNDRIKIKLDLEDGKFNNDEKRILQIYSAIKFKDIANGFPSESIQSWVSYYQCGYIIDDIKQKDCEQSELIPRDM